MRANWQEVPRGDVMPQQAGIYVTMSAKGRIAMSRLTYEALGGPSAFIVLFDRANSRIGLKPTHSFVKNAYPALVANRSGGKYILAYRLIVEHRIDLPHTIRFHDADIDDDGILRLDLRTAKLCSRAYAHKGSRRGGGVIDAEEGVING